MGCGGVGAYSTMMVPVIDGWMEQWYSYVPGVVKKFMKVSCWLSVLDMNPSPCSAWGTVSLFCQVMAVRAGIRMTLGLNPLASIHTVLAGISGPVGWLGVVG